MRPRIKPRGQRPEPADEAFVVLLRDTARGSARRSWRRLMDYLAVEGEQAAWREVVDYCFQASDLLNERDRRFITDLKKIVERYPITEKQAQWLVDIVERLQRCRTRRA